MFDVKRTGAILIGVWLALVACSPGPSPASTQAPGADPPATTAPRQAATLLPEESPPFSTFGWSTDFSKHSVPYDEILSGGPPKDGIPAIDHPKFEAVAAADAWLENREPVMSFQLGNDARAYPLQILIWHEIVNDVVAGRPVVITFCPLCNTAIAFDRTLDGVVYDFGTTGKLRFSDLVMYDRQTESWWQQITGEAIVGELTGQRLALLPASIVSWADFKAAFPQGQVLSADTGFIRDYGRNPYGGYDDVNAPPFLYAGPDYSGQLPPKERVVAFTLGEVAAAYPFSVLEKLPAINDTVNGMALVVFWKPGTSSALDTASIPAGRDIGATGVFRREVNGQTLTFSPEGDNFKDAETGSTWNILGQAIAGPRIGTQLEAIVHGNHFWFSWVVFRPDTIVYQAP